MNVKEADEQVSESRCHGSKAKWWKCGIESKDEKQYEGDEILKRRKMHKTICTRAKSHIRPQGHNRDSGDISEIHGRITTYSDNIIKIFRASVRDYRRFSKPKSSARPIRPAYHKDYISYEHENVNKRYIVPS